MSSPRLTVPEKIWFSALFLAGSALFVRAAPPVLSRCLDSHDGWWLAGFTVLTFLSLFRQVRLSGEDYHSVYTLDDIPLYALIFVKGWQFGVVAGTVARLSFELWRVARALRLHPERVHPVHVLYHCSDIPAIALVAGATGFVYAALAPGTPFLSDLRSLGAVLGASLVWLPLAFTITAISLTLRRQVPLWKAIHVIRENFGHVRVHIAMLLPLGALLAYFVEHQPVVAALLLVPVTTMHNALEAEHKVSSESEHTIQALAHYLEASDEYTQGHSERVSQYAAEIAREMGLSAADVDRVRRAGLIHDIGKVDIPDAILRKPGQLTEDERKIMRTHTDRAVQLGEKLEYLQLPFQEAAYHHENYDGTGHFRMVAEQIPLTSRILAVADTFDAMTSDRPYRKGMPVEQAIERLEKARGSQLDPQAVDAFLAACRSGAIEAVKARWAEKAQAGNKE